MKGGLLLVVTKERAGRVELVGWNVLCPGCSELIPAPNSLIGMCIWSAAELAEFKRAYCPACGLSFPVGKPGEEGE